MPVQTAAVQGGEAWSLPAISNGCGGWWLLGAPSLCLPCFHICHLACSPQQPLKVGYVNICFSTNPSVDLERVLGSRSGFCQLAWRLGRSPPAPCVLPLDRAALTLPTLERNKWRMLTSGDLEIASLTLSSAGEQRGRQSSNQMPAFSLPKYMNC